MTREADAAIDGLPLTLDLQPEIDAALATLVEGSGEHCLSDHAFSNLYLFREAHDYRFRRGPLPCVSGQTYDGTRHLMPLFRLGDVPIEHLRERLIGHHCYYPVAPAHIEKLDRKRLTISESPDDADYLFTADTFRDYAGRPLAKKRNQMRSLLAAHDVRSESFGARHAGAAMDVLAGWMQHKGKEEGEADQRACLEAIRHAEAFGLTGFIHYAEAAAIGFVLAQRLQPGVFVMRFAKGLDSHKGIYQYMFHHFVRHHAEPVRWLNFEQDMGLAGFRRSKASYGPAEMLCKLRVSIASLAARAQGRPM
ncbi:MAG: hypothetical protein JWQ11_2582 [Rhizobacter sp.]|nr:hypothetical protein [Rhizobacter sp.]